MVLIRTRSLKQFISREVEWWNLLINLNDYSRGADYENNP